MIIDDSYDMLVRRYGRRRAAAMLRVVDRFGISETDPMRAVHLAEERVRQFDHGTGAFHALLQQEGD